MIRNAFLALMLLVPCLAKAALFGPDVEPVALRCEYLKNPLGIDVAKPRLSWKIEAPKDLRDIKQTAYRILVASSEKLLKQDKGDLWDSGKVTSDRSIQIEYAGKSFVSHRQYFWKVRVACGQGWSQGSEPAWFVTGILNPADWQSAAWIGMKSADKYECPWLRKSFVLDRVPESAFVSVASIGYHELYVNGKKFDDRVLAPSVSYLKKRVLYNTYDIRGLLKPGRNSVGLWLAPGWAMLSNPHTDIAFHDVPKYPVAKALITFTSEKAIVTDGSWKCSLSSVRHIGQWAYSDFGGDRLDVQKELAGWSGPEFDDSSWAQAAAYDVNKSLSAELAPPNRMTEVIKPRKIIRLGEKKFRIEMEKLFTGWIRIAIRKETPGAKVTITSSSYDGSECEFSQRNECILDQKGEGVFCNRFSYQQFKYAIVSGISSEPSLEDVSGFRVGNDFKPVGDFSCSNELLNKIYKYNLNTFRNLTTGGMTVDCPHRERLGYAEGAQGFAETVLNNYVAGPYYTQLMQGWRDVQGADGYIPHSVPTIYGGGGPAWSGGIVFIPWEVFLTYADRRILEECYPAMKKWMEFLDSKTDDGGLLQSYGGFWGFLGDWITPHGKERSDSREALLFNNCYYLYSFRTMAKIAGCLGKDEDARLYSGKAETVAGAINERFYDKAGAFYLDRRQGHLLMPLISGAVPGDSVKSVMRNLEEEIIIGKKGHLDVGDPGVYYLTKFLTENDRSDLIFEYANKKDFPGYGCFIEQGLQTWPEHWKTGPGVSLMHSCFPGIGAWFQEGLGGIRFDDLAPGFKKFIIKPSVVGDLTWVKCHYDSMYGRIVSNWKREAGKLTMEVVVPPNTTATIFVPAKNPDGITGAKGVKFLRMENGAAVYEVGSGNYKFSSELGK